MFDLRARPIDSDRRVVIVAGAARDRIDQRLDDKGREFVAHGLVAGRARTDCFPSIQAAATWLSAITSGGQRKRVARQLRKLPRDRSDSPNINAHFLDELPLQSWIDLGEKGESGSAEVGRAARISD